MIRAVILMSALTATGALAQPLLNLTPPTVDMVWSWTCAADGERFSTDTIVVYESNGTFEMRFDYASTSLRSGSYHIIGTAQGTYESPSNGGSSIFETLTDVQIDRVYLEGEETDNLAILDAFEASLIATYPNQTSFIQLSANQIVRTDGSLARGLCNRSS